MHKDANKKIAFIQSCWHKDIVDRCREGFSAQLAEYGMSAEVDYFQVPGAFELPLKCKQLLVPDEYALVVAAGFVVDGGIYRHEFVAQAVISGLMQVQLEMARPVLSVVLTPKDFQQTEAHQNFFLEHMIVKGKEAADVAVSVLEPAESGGKPQEKITRVS